MILIAMSINIMKYINKYKFSTSIIVIQIPNLHVPKAVVLNRWLGLVKLILNVDFSKVQIRCTLISKSTL